MMWRKARILGVFHFLPSVKPVHCRGQYFTSLYRIFIVNRVQSFLTKYRTAMYTVAYHSDCRKQSVPLNLYLMFVREEVAHVVGNRKGVFADQIS